MSPQSFPESLTARTALCAVLLAAVCLLAPFSKASASAFTTLHTFCEHADCRDGAYGIAPPFEDASGNLYGTARGGGKEGAGLAFELTPGGETFTILYKFCSKRNCSDGSGPGSGLIMDVNGNLYGTTTDGGKFGEGTVFELVPDASHSKYDLVTLYDFCASSCSEGKNPSFGNLLSYAGQSSSALYDGVSPLYGTTSYGGSGYYGTAFELDYVSGESARQEKVLYNFCSLSSCTDGSQPAGLVVGSDGSLFGTTTYGGSANDGVVFQVRSNAGAFSGMFFTPSARRTAAMARSRAQL
ncbi:MAG TPA: choice-of-anchor tandem repeat GloVer-containing protein [Rhizomicrobium sp.]|jgi:uncharacterized repeat protein (TIGR03803 family)